MDISEILKNLNSERPDFSGLQARTPIGNDAMVYKCGWRFDWLSDRKERCIEGHCTACGGDVVFDLAPMPKGSAPGFFDWTDEHTIIKNGEAVECPACGETVMALHTSMIKRDSYSIGVAWPVRFWKVDGDLVITQWCAQKEVNRDGRSWIHAYKRHGIIVTEKGLTRIKGYVKAGFDRIAERDWYSLKTWADEFGETDGDEVVEWDRNVVIGTAAEKSGIEDAVEKVMKHGRSFPVGTYLYLWRAHPNVENLVRQGFGKLLAEALKDSKHIRGYYYSSSEALDISVLKKILDLKAAKPHEILRVKKEDLERIREAHLTKELPLLLGLQFMRKRGENPEKLTDEEVAKLGDRDIQRNIEEGTAGFHPPVIRMARYMAKQNKSEWLLKDYWNMLAEFYGELPEAMIWPKDLQKAHDELSARIRVKRDAAVNENVMKAAEKAAWMCFTDKRLGLMIRPAADQMELIAEGKALNHCVASYAKAVAEGRTLILFIRKTRAKKRSFYTLEFRDGKVNQNRGANNCERTAEVREFEAEWLEYLKEVQNGKCNGKRRAS